MSAAATALVTTDFFNALQNIVYPIAAGAAGSLVSSTAESAAEEIKETASKGIQFLVDHTDEILDKLGEDLQSNTQSLALIDNPFVLLEIPRKKSRRRGRRQQQEEEMVPEDESQSSGVKRSKTLETYGFASHKQVLQKRPYEYWVWEIWNSLRKREPWLSQFETDARKTLLILLDESLSNWRRLNSSRDPIGQDLRNILHKVMIDTIHVMESRMSEIANLNQVWDVYKAQRWFAGLMKRRHPGSFPNFNFNMPRSNRYVTKRGVKRMIASGDYTTDFIERYFSNAGNVTSIYGEWGGASAHTGGMSTFNNMTFHSSDDITAIASELAPFFTFPTEDAAAGQPDADDRVIRWKDCSVEFMFHNPLSERYEASFWWLECSCDVTDTQTPITVWEAEYIKTLPNAATGPDFNRNYVTFPTKHREWREHWRIVKKIKAVFNPGDVKKWRCDLPNGKSAANERAANSFINGVTHVLMIQLKGIPHHNWTAGGAEEVNVIERSRTHLEWVWDYTGKWGFANNRYANIIFGDDHDATFNEARAWVPQAETVIHTI